jgi:hypothetical protein
LSTKSSNIFEHCEKSLARRAGLQKAGNGPCFEAYGRLATKQQTSCKSRKTEETQLPTLLTLRQRKFTRAFFSASYLTTSLLTVLLSTTSHADVEQDRASIRAFAGCYDVSYNFAETFVIKPGYKIASPYFTTSTELVVVDEDSANRVSLQHILISDEAGPMKHWRQEWTHEGASFFQYQGDDLWTKHHLTSADSQGQWVQRVLNVDDSPQYECSAPWVHWGDTSYWECEGWSPLPRREYSTRSDYNVLGRRNRQALTNAGWRHEQNNTKLQLNVLSRVVQPLVQEVGVNIYTRIDDKQCAEARAWWIDNQATWHSIQAAWHSYYDTNEKIKFTCIST